MSSEFLALAKSTENLPHTTARPVRCPKGKYHSKVNVQRVTDMSVRFQGAMMIYSGLRHIFLYVKQLTVEYGRYTFNANPQREWGRNHRSVACFLITGKIGTEKLLIPPLPAFHLYHSSYSFCSVQLWWKSSEQRFRRVWVRAFCGSEQKGEGVKNLGAIHNESSLPFIQQKFQFMFEFLIRNRKTEKE